MTEREKIIEAMARAIEKSGFKYLKETGNSISEGWGDVPESVFAQAALTAIAEQGYAVVPREAVETAVAKLEDEGFHTMADGLIDIRHGF